MNKINSFIKPFLLVFALSIVGVSNMNAQENSQDFWECFSLIANLDEFKAHYPSDNEVYTILDNEMVYPTSTTDLSLSILEKGVLFDGSHSEFFVIQNVVFQGETSHVDLVYYYNFQGDFRHFQGGRFDLAKVDGVWEITNSELTQSNN